MSNSEIQIRQALTNRSLSPPFPFLAILSMAPYLLKSSWEDWAALYAPGWLRVEPAAANILFGPNTTSSRILPTSWWILEPSSKLVSKQVS